MNNKDMPAYPSTGEGDKAVNNEQLLKEYNCWRRGHSGYEMPNPTAVGIAIDSVIAQLATLKEENEQLDDVYTGAVDTLDAWHEKRAKARLPMTCQGSVIDGIASLCQMIETLQDKNEGLKARVAELEEFAAVLGVAIDDIPHSVDECFQKLNAETQERINQRMKELSPDSGCEFPLKEPANEG